MWPLQGLTLCFVGLVLLTKPAPHASQLTQLLGNRIVWSSKRREGGTGGAQFADLVTTRVVGIQALSVSFDNQLESIQATYRLANGSFATSPRRGGSKYPQHNITFGKDEYVVGVSGKTSGTIVDQISIHTVRPHKHQRVTYGPFGSAGEKDFLLEGYVVGFCGYSSERLDNVGIFFPSLLLQSEYFGGDGRGAVKGEDFDEHPDYFFASPITKVTKILVHSGNVLNSLQLEYLLLGGSTARGKRYGKPSEELTVIDIKDTEVLRGVLGKSDGDCIDQITFLSHDYDGNADKTYGPFGRTGSRPFSAYGNIMGITGNAGEQVNGLSLYYI